MHDAHACYSCVSVFAWLKRGGVDPVCDALSLTAEVCANPNFAQLYYWADVVTCRKFEGHEMLWSFTEETYDAMHLVQAVAIGNLEGDTLKMYGSKIIHKPLQIL